MGDVYQDPVTGRSYEVGPDGVTRWVDERAAVAPFGPAGGAAPVPYVAVPQAAPYVGAPQQPVHGAPGAGGYAPRPAPSGVRPVVAIAVIVVALFALAVVGAIGLGIVAAFSGRSTGTSHTTGGVGAADGVAAVHPPDFRTLSSSPVTDGTLEFTVTGIATAKTVGSSTFTATAQGRYVLVYVDVRNVGSSPTLLSTLAQKLVDGGGREFSADSSASLYARGRGGFFGTVNPGLTVSTVIAFDVPEGTPPASVELHGGVLTPGATVRLS